METSEKNFLISAVKALMLQVARKHLDELMRESFTSGALTVHLPLDHTELSGPINADPVSGTVYNIYFQVERLRLASPGRILAVTAFARLPSIGDVMYDMEFDV